MAVQTATPFHFSVVGTAVRFILANGALIYKPTANEIRVLFLDGSLDEEIQIDPRRLLVEAIPELRNSPSGFTVDPLHYSDGIASFLFEIRGQDQLIICNMRQKTVLGTRHVERRNSLFVRNTSDYLYYGFRQKFPGDRWEWVVRGYNLLCRAWMVEQRIPMGFSGSVLGQDVCFEIIDGYLYGVSSATISPPSYLPSNLDSFYRVFRIKLGDSSSSSRQDLPKRFSWRRPWSEGCIDLRYNDLTLTKDEKTGILVIYEARKEWTPIGYTERNCHRKAIGVNNFSADESFPGLTLDGSISEEPNLEAHVELFGRENVHAGDNGLELGRDCGRLYAHTYHAATRSFIDVIGTQSVSEPGQERLRLRVRPMARYIDDSLSNWSLRGESPADSPYLWFWPPEPTPGRDDPTLNLIHALMNPKKGPIDKVRWAADDRFFVFSPVGKERSELSALILVSFDPRLRLHGLRKADGSPERPVPQSLVGTTLHSHPSDPHWASNVQPFHLVIKSPEGRRYGFDFTS